VAGIGAGRDGGRQTADCRLQLGLRGRSSSSACPATGRGSVDAALRRASAGDDGFPRRPEVEVGRELV
jgi:hypothetical protein